MVLLGLIACSVLVDGVQVAGGPTVEQERQVDVFDHIEAASSIDVEVTIAEGPQRVLVEAADGQLDSVRTSVEGGLLRIDAHGSGVFSSRRVLVTCPELAAITTSSSGDVMVEGLDGQSLRVVGSGSGDVELDGEVGDLDVVLSSLGGLEVERVAGALSARLSGSGDLQVAGGQISAVELSLSSLGDADVAGIEADQVTVVTTGSGDIVLVGRAGELVARVASMGDIDASRLETTHARVTGDGSGDLFVHTSEDVSGTLTSMGDLEVRGGGRVQVTTTGTGDIDVR